MPDDSPGWTTLLGMGVAIAAQIALGLVLGWLVDNAVGTRPVFLIVGLALGIVGAVAYTCVQFRQFLKH